MAKSPPRRQPTAHQATANDAATGEARGDDSANPNTAIVANPSVTVPLLAANPISPNKIGAAQAGIFRPKAIPSTSGVPSENPNRLDLRSLPHQIGWHFRKGQVHGAATEGIAKR